MSRVILPRGRYLIEKLYMTGRSYQKDISHSPHSIITIMIMIIIIGGRRGRARGSEEHQQRGKKTVTVSENAMAAADASLLFPWMAAEGVRASRGVYSVRQPCGSLTVSFFVFYSTGLQCLAQARPALAYAGIDDWPWNCKDGSSGLQ